MKKETYGLVYIDIWTIRMLTKMGKCAIRLTLVDKVGVGAGK